MNRVNVRGNEIQYMPDQTSGCGLVVDNTVRAVCHHIPPIQNT